MDTKSLLNSVLNWALTTGAKLLLSLVILFFTFKLINFISRKIERSTERHTADKTITRTLVYIFRIAAKIIVVICLVGYVGIGLAVNGALSNLAGGVLILLTRPFRIDDFIEAEGYSGTVEEIHITNTRLRTPDNKILFIPNGSLSNGTIVNYSLQSKRRVDLIFSISFKSDFKKAQQIINEICSVHSLILSDPAPLVRMSEHASSSLLITTRAWTKTDDYWTVKFDLLEQVKERFDAEGIEIPYNQVDVHIKKG